MSDEDEREEDPYAKEENYLRTDGRDCCHWCYLRPQEWVWGPYGTRVCDHCQQMAAEGRAHDIVEELGARMTVRGWPRLIRDPEGWRTREHERMTRWLEVRTTCEPVPPAPDRGKAATDYQEPDWLKQARQIPDEPFDPGTF